MGISVKAFGTGGKRARIFQDIYFSIEEVDGMGVIYTKTGEYSAIIKMQNPVLKFSADVESYYSFVNLMTSVVTTLGEGYALHKQDVFIRKTFDRPAEEPEGDNGKRFLSEAYFRFFKGRPYTASSCYLVITQESKKGGLFTFESKKWNDFKMKVQKVYSLLSDSGIDCSFMNVDETREYVDRFFAVNFCDKVFSMTDFMVDSEGIYMGSKQCKVFSLIDLDSVGLPNVLRPYADMNIDNISMPVDLMHGIDSVPDADTMIYNQVLFVPNQKKEQNNLEKKQNKHRAMANPANMIAAKDIEEAQEVMARENRQLVYSHFNMIVCTDAKKDMEKVTNHLENIFSKQNIRISRRAYNQLELFVASFPGNCFALSPKYDRFLTFCEAALCLMYKERQTQGDISPLRCYYTDRQGVPMAVDTTGKEGKKKYTNNSNFFVLGPSGSGKSFFMNTVIRQYYEQDTDCVIVDTGDSYEGICGYFGGIYISYSKESPISMNPFKVTEAEYTQNFGEKKNFLKSLIFLIFKGTEKATKIEETIINQTIVEYYREYFTPFTGYSDLERKELADRLVLQYKKDGTYETFEKEFEKAYNEKHGSMPADDADREYEEKLMSRQRKLQNIIDDSAATDGEKSAAKKKKDEAQKELIRLNQLTTSSFDEKISRDIIKMELQRSKLRVTELSFNTYYEFAVERIPQIMRQQNVEFAIHDFATILMPFYKGGELEYTLNNDMDSTLFDEKFIVFEIDKVKDDPVLFPIIVLIIMDVFTQKMRIKKGRKCLVIEEAWKAIATPVMAEYIKYLYKTARKHWAMVGVVTQEIQDITSSDIVKEAIINNSDVFMLLDQSKFKDKFDDIKATLALTDNDCSKIFTINRLDNKAGRSPFKEVFIKRGTEGDVFGVEEPRECYISYTTEKAEKEALKIYVRAYNGDYQKAIVAFIHDWERSGIGKSLEFARRVLKEGVLNLSPKGIRAKA